MLAPVALALRPWSGSRLRRVETSFSIKGAPPPSPLIHVHISSTGKRIDELRKVCSKSYSFRIRAVAVDSTDRGSSQTTHEERLKRYHFVVANAKFMLDEEEHFKELLFEKRRNYDERKKEQDFWLLIEPKFLDQFPDITKRLQRPAVALVSTDDRWITFMKLRLDRVLAGNYEAGTLKEALAFNNADLRFKNPGKWLAPYLKYEFGWWEPFLPQLYTEGKTE